MKYVLKNKDIAVLEFEVEKKQVGEFPADIDIFASYTQEIENIKIINENLIPINLHLSTQNPNNNQNALEKWIKKRKTPNNRKFVMKILASFRGNNDDNMLMDYIDVSLGLSLNDSFWIIPADKDYKWKDYNLYDNKFSEILELVAFNGESHKVKGVTSSPEYTTNGMLRKCWHRENDKIFLYKGSSEPFANYGREAYSEFYMAQVAEAMNLNHISYDLKEFHNSIVSSCEIFTNENEGYIPIYYLMDKTIIENNNKRALIREHIPKIYGIESLQDLLLFDSIIYNVDRHLENFGMIVDNNTNKILRPAPIFDNGCSIINSLVENDLKNINNATKEYVAWQDTSFDLQLKQSVQPQHIESLEKLLSFTFKRHEKFNLDESWLKPIESHIQERADLAITIAKEKAKILIKSQNHDKSRDNSQKRSKGRGL